MTIYYTVTEQKIDSLKNYAIYIRHFNMAIGILLGAIITLVLGAIWDESPLEEKITVFFVISAFIMGLLYLKRKTQSKIDRIWQYINESEV
ncbi:MULTISPECIES: hypothetical protein [Bartonella]|uniref:Membrane protein n=1 Tax=Bartonella chomelii TaxID=236402 RepID=A0ABR6E4I3_9HYPH|nr:MULTISPECIES: hypothetical protein [Bartonella]MBA9083471.1 putative membrane protein [Bartonella chomelii]